MTLTPPVRLPARVSDAHKGKFGRALLIGGSRGMSGSIAMSAIGALKSGAGLVTAAVPDRCLETVASFHPAVMTVPLSDDGRGRFSITAASELNNLGGRSLSAIGCGPGMTTEAGSVRIVERLINQKTVSRVFDADAINVLSKLQWSTPGVQLGPLVLTPHPGELRRLTGVSSRDRDAQIEAAVQLAKATGVIIVAKGGPTVVVGPDETWTNMTGNPGMASAGSGDVLTGVVTALLGQSLSPWDAARLAVWVHGHAGDLAAERYGQVGMTASEILGCLPDAMRAAT